MSPFSFMAYLERINQAGTNIFPDIPLYFFASSKTCYTYIIRLQAYNSIDILYKNIRL